MSALNCIVIYPTAVETLCSVTHILTFTGGAKKKRLKCQLGGGAAGKSRSSTAQLND